jgi:amidase
MDSALRMSAVQAVRALRRGEVSPLELVDAVADRLAEAEPVVNALVTQCLDRARRQARRLISTAARSRAHDPAWLGGLPVTVKDVVDVAGAPTTFGSPLYRRRVAERSDRLVERIERRGAIVVGKTNLPEFCSGADTVSPVAGRTANPCDPAVSCGASSGGAAASVAAGEVWCAHGTDTAGSIRIPAACCGTVGLRPTPGLVPGGRGDDPGGFEQHGPLARDAADAALFFRAMLGGPLPDAPADPFPRRRVAVSLDLGGTVPIDDEIRQAAVRAAKLLQELGWVVEEAVPALDPAPETVHEACLTLLAHRALVRHGNRVDRAGDAIGPALRAEVAAGRQIPPDRLNAARRTRERFRRAAARFFERYDVLLTATFGVPPWPVHDGAGVFPPEPHLSRIAAVWPLTTLAPMAGCPAVTVPAGRTAAGHPIGLQLTGAPMSDLRLLRAARTVEATGEAP